MIPWRPFFAEPIFTKFYRIVVIVTQSKICKRWLLVNKLDGLSCPQDLNFNNDVGYNKSIAFYFKIFIQSSSRVTATMHYACIILSVINDTVK